jgi:DNA-binding HxlR family transcriptional regulator
MLDTNRYVPNVRDPECPTRTVLDRMGDRWGVLVVLHLLEGTRRFSELRDRIGGITPKALTHVLRALERDGLLERMVYAEVPPRVEYSLTPLGRSLSPVIDVITGWAEANIYAIEKARATYDSRVAATPQ